MMVARWRLSLRSSRRGLGSVVMAAFIIATVILFTALLFFYNSMQRRMYEVQLERVQLENYRAQLAKSIQAYYALHSSELELNVTNKGTQPTSINAILVYYGDGRWDLLNETGSLRYSEFVNASIVNINGVVEWSTDDYAELQARLPIALGPGDTLRVFLRPLVQVSVEAPVIKAQVSGMAVAAQVSFTRPTGNVTVVGGGPAPPRYSVELAPVVAGEGTWMVLGSGVEGHPSTLEEVWVEYGSHVSGSTSSLMYDDDDYYVAYSEPTCWLQGWTYRRRVTVVNSIDYTLEGYQVRIELDSSNFDFSKANPDGSDIRFTNESGQELPYWIEKWDPDDEEAVIWVKVPKIPASGETTIYMYYGNPSATSESDILEVMEQLPADDGPGYQIYYQEWVMPVSGLIGGGTARGWHADDGAWRLTLPFDFPYYNGYLNTFWVCSNGFVSESRSTDWSDSVSELRTRKMIAPFWEDLMTCSPHDVYTRSYSDDYGQAYVIRWYTDFFYYHGVANFELMLYENGLIRLNYGYIDGWLSDRPTVGLSLGDSVHYTVSSYNDKPADWYSNRNSLLFWPRKKASTEPTVVVGEEEVRYLASVATRFTGVPSTALGLNVTVKLVLNATPADVSILLWDYSLSRWVEAASYTYTTGSEEAYVVRVAVGDYVSASGEVQVLVNASIGQPLRLSLDQVSVEYLTLTEEVVLYVAVGGSSDVVSYNTSAERWNTGLSPAPFEFSVVTPIAYDLMRTYIWCSNSTHLLRYDVVADEWSVVSSLPGGTSLGAGTCMVVVGDELYLLVGGGSSVILVYDVEGGAWSASSTPEPVEEYTCCCEASGKVYVVFGGSGDLYEYDPSTSTWSLLGVAPTAYPVGLAYDPDRGYLWVLGRYGGLHYYDLSSGTWGSPSSQPPLYPVAPCNRLAYYGAKLYFMRGDGTRELWVIPVA